MKGRLLELALDQGLSEMIKAGYAAPLVDTATMYHNDAQILKVLSKYPNVLVCSKIKQAGEAGKVELKHLIETYGDRLKRVILHKYMSTDNFDNLLVAKRAGLVKEIGVSNYSVAQLEELIGKCNGKPDVVQNEFHPFLRTSVPAFCKKHGIKFEAHSVMTRIDSLQPFATEWGVSAGQIALAYAFQAGGGGAQIEGSNAQGATAPPPILCAASCASGVSARPWVDAAEAEEKLPDAQGESGRRCDWVDRVPLELFRVGSAHEP